MTDLRPKSPQEEDEDLDAAIKRGEELQRGTAQRSISVDIQIADRGKLRRKTLHADLENEAEMTELRAEVTETIQRSTGGM